LTTRALEVLAGYLSFTDGPKTAPNAGLNVSSWPIATDDALTASRRFRGIADMAGLAGLRCGKANDRCGG